MGNSTNLINVTTAASVVNATSGETVENDEKMEIYPGVLIFITCMIILALLIYYFQEKANPKYSINDYQQGISAIALAVAAPTFSSNSKHRASGYPRSPSHGLPPEYLAQTQSNPYSSEKPPPGFEPPPGFMLQQTQPSPYAPAMAPYAGKAPLRPGYARALVVPEDDTSDSGSSSSSNIYFSPHSAAYSVNKRMSMTANVAAMTKRMSVAASYPAGTRPSVDARMFNHGAVSKSPNKHALVRMNTNPEPRRTNYRPPLQKSATIAERSSPSPSDSATGQSFKPKESSSSETKNRRSTSPYTPANIVKFHLKNKSKRSGSPYSPLRSDSPSILTESEASSACKDTDSVSPSAPQRNKKILVKQSASLPSQAAENVCVDKRSESLPPKQSESVLAKKSDNLLPKANVNSADRVNLSSSEVSYRSHSPTPLHTLEEEE